MTHVEVIVASSFYEKVLNTLSAYVEDKGEGVLTRALKHIGKDLNTLVQADMAALLKWLVPAATLYLGDKAKAPELEKKLQRLAGLP